MKMVVVKKCLVLLLLFCFISACSIQKAVTEKANFDRSITVFDSEKEMVNFFSNLQKYDEVDEIYREEQKWLKEIKVRTKRKDSLKLTYFDCILSKTSSLKEACSKVMDVLRHDSDFLSADEIGDIPALSIGEALEVVTGASSFDTKESITNNQEDNVDEGDIVKRVGNYLVVLRKGVLYSIALQTQYSELISKVDLLNNVSGDDAWYDELLVVDNNLIVVGYNYGKFDGTELIFYQIDEYGKIEFNQRYFIETDDYFDSENSATRIVGDRLIMVLPNYEKASDLLELSESGTVLSELYVERFVQNSIDPEKINIAENVSWVYSGGEVRRDNGNLMILNCSLAELNLSGLKCSVSNLLGLSGYGSDLYVNKNAVYIWTDSRPSFNYEELSLEEYDYLIRLNSGKEVLKSLDQEKSKQVIYRVGLDDMSIGSVLVDGGPINQFSFYENAGVFSGVSAKEDENNEDIVHVEGVKFAVNEFSLNPEPLSSESYTQILVSESWPNENRFMGDYTFISDTTYSKGEATKTEVAVWNRKTGVVDTAHRNFVVSAFHPQWPNMLVMGYGDQKQLVLETMTVSPNVESINIQSFDQYRSAESRNVGFNSTAYPGGNVFGVPVYRLDENGDVEIYNFDQSIDIAYFNNPVSGNFNEIGVLKGLAEVSEDDCKVSCYGWYGVARPFFINEYIYALIDNEVLKGKIEQGKVKTLNRLNLNNGQVLFE